MIHVEEPANFLDEERLNYNVGTIDWDSTGLFAYEISLFFRRKVGNADSFAASRVINLATAAHFSIRCIAVEVSFTPLAIYTIWYRDQKM